MSRFSVSPRVFSREFKFSVVEEYLSGSLGASALSKKYSIHLTTLYSWIRTFAPEHKFNSCIAMSKRKKESESDEIRSLKLALRQKELELRREKMRADLYETMVDVAEEQFNICIRKKAGTKQ